VARAYPSDPCRRAMVIGSCSTSALSPSVSMWLENLPLASAVVVYLAVVSVAVVAVAVAFVRVLIF
jgi:hypothetical protein